METELKPTEKLYDRDAYRTVFTAEVLRCTRGTAEGEFFVWLDRTLFFPEEGGQSPDRGVLGGFPVTDVQLSDGRIRHTVRGSFPEGSAVTGEIDWVHRFSNMQQHSGEHMFSGLVYRRFGFSNVGFHLSDSCVTMDFGGAFSYEAAQEIEDAVNAAIWDDTEISARYVPKEELAGISYRSKKEIEGDVRLVTIYGKEGVLDVCACCAPHVKRTGEIGCLRIVSFENYKGGVRIGILCGKRALSDMKRKQDSLDGICRLLSVNTDRAGEAAEQLVSRLKQAEYELTGFRRERILREADSLPEDRLPVLFFENADTDGLRLAVNRLTEKRSGISAAFSGSDGEFRFLLGSRDTDVRPLGELLKSRFPAKGGGKAGMVQGSLTAEKTELIRVLTEYFGGVS